MIGKQRNYYYRELLITAEKEVMFIGKNKKDIATHEFIGTAKFSARGAQNLIEVYEDCARRHKGRFHESESFERALIMDMLQEMIDRRFKIQLYYIDRNETKNVWKYTTKRIMKWQRK